jgi:hypothetical protein
MHSRHKELSRFRMSRYAYCPAAMLMFVALLVCIGCGDVFRPVANPIPGATTDPSNFHLAVVVSRNAAGNPGTGMQIDVSGDSNVGVVNAGQQPLYAALLRQSGRVFVSNSDGTITTFTPAGFFGSIGSPTTISLPAGLVPGFLTSTETGTMYAATSGTDGTHCITPPSTGAVLAINAGSLTTENIMCVGANPVVLAETPDARKLYTVNSDGTVSSINTVDNSVNPAITCCATPLMSPLGVVASSDSSQVFILDASGAIWSINTLTDQPSLRTTLAAPSNRIALNTTRNQLYVSSPASASGSATLNILDASSPTLTPLNSAPLALPAGSNPQMMTFLPNGSRAYVLSSTSTNTPVVSVINTSTHSVFSTINLPAATVNPGAVSTCQAPGVHPFTMAAAGNSSRLYVTNCYAANTTVIDTVTNKKLLTMNSPTSAYSPLPGTPYPPPQNPVFVVAGP